MNSNQKESALRNNIQQCQVDNSLLDQEFMRLIDQAASKLRDRAQLLGLELLVPTPGFIRDPQRAAITQLALAMADLRLSLRCEQPGLTPIEVARLSMADTFVGRLLGFGFRSAEEGGIVGDSEITMTAPEFQKFIGERLAEKRKGSNLSQKDVADAIEMSTASVGRIESGKQRLGMSVLLRILGALKMHPSEILPPEAFPFETELPSMSLKEVRELRSSWPKFDREILQPWEEKLAKEAERSESEDA